MDISLRGVVAYLVAVVLVLFAVFLLVTALVTSASVAGALVTLAGSALAVPVVHRWVADRFELSWTVVTLVVVVLLITGVGFVLVTAPR